MTTPEADGRSMGWAEVLTPILNDLTIVSWAENKLSEYKRLPKVNRQERKNVNILITETAGQLLQNPQNIEIAADVWKNTEDQTGLEFYELIKKGSGELIKEKWESITSEQLVQLVRIYANNPQFKDFAKELLASYFEGPRNRRQRVDAYYAFASATLDLAGEGKAFDEGARIGLHDTDILRRDKNLIEQIVFLSLPYTEEEIVFQKLLIANNVILQLSLLTSEDLGEARQRYADFLKTDEVTEKWKEEETRARKRIGSTETRKLYEAATQVNAHFRKSLSAEDILKLKDTWPFNLLFDETDLLNIKFQSALPRIADLKMRS